MELRDVLKKIRTELGLSQTEFANAMHVNYATVNRWEAGKTYPNQSILAALVQFAASSGLSADCMQQLKVAISRTKRAKIAGGKDKLYTVEHRSLSQLIDDASYPIYVCDMETDNLLYINHACENMLGGTLGQFQSRKCYTCLMDRDAPCQFCHKNELTAERFTTFQAFRPKDHTYQLVQSKLIQWNGRKAHVHYVFDRSSDVNVEEKSVRESAYEQQLSLRRELAGDAIAAAHYNLTHDTVSGVASSNAEFEKLLSTHPLDDILNRLKNDVFRDDDLAELESTGDRKTLIQRFYEGKTHITFRHYIESMGGVFEGTFDLMQNPVTYDIEAFAHLHDVTRRAIRSEISRRLLEIDYETVVAIDTETGEAQPYVGYRIQEVIAEQKIAGNNIAGVETYLRKHCADEDIERVITGTSLPYVKQQLEKSAYYYITYSLRKGSTIVYKRALFSYLDRRHKTILCAMQDLTDLHAYENKKRNQLAEALQTLHEQAGMDIARYDMKTKRFYTNSAMASAVGCGDIIENVPEAFIESGLVTPAYADQYRRYFDQLRRGKGGSITIQCRVGDGSMHWLHIDAHVLRSAEDEPYQALLAFRDVENEVEQATLFKKWRQGLERKQPDDYTLFRCNLSKDASFDKMEGTLLKIVFSPEAKTFNDRTKEYADRFVHTGDFGAYTKLLNAENLIAGYHRGTRMATLDYRERVSADAYQWLRVTVELAQYPDLHDIEAFLMYERIDAAPCVAADAAAFQGAAFENSARHDSKH